MKIYKIRFSLHFLLALCMKGDFDGLPARVIDGIPKDATVDNAYIHSQGTEVVVEFSTSDAGFIKDNKGPEFLPIFGY